MEITWSVISGEGLRGKGTGNKKHKWQVESRQGEVKNSTGNGEEAKELICTTHGHEIGFLNLVSICISCLTTLTKENVQGTDCVIIVWLN